MLGTLARNSNSASVTRKMRLQRFEFFLSCLEMVRNSPSSREDSPPIQVLDIGGTQSFWEWMNFVDIPGVFITLVNPSAAEVDVRYNNFRGIAGDGTNLNFIEDKQYDIVFSNSVIEHVATLENQHKMANEILRVGVRYFVQTPNYHFPIEPHFLFPGFQWLPMSVRIRLLHYFPLFERRVGGKRLDFETAKAKAEEIRLLKRNELLALFPTASLYTEKTFGMTKSFVVHNFPSHI